MAVHQTSDVVPDAVKARKVIRSPWKYGAHKHHMLLQGTQDHPPDSSSRGSSRRSAQNQQDHPYYNPLITAGSPGGTALGSSPSEPDLVASEGYVERPWPEARRLVYRDFDWSKSLTALTTKDKGKRKRTTSGNFDDTTGSRKPSDAPVPCGRSDS
jgi:hypothetical protein